ncbi:extracellular solute-binding protein [Marinactinospora thermotolerans]|uniref:Carbohydrate ABC transporter substrate-binding protein, CUT1 family (TC 3.A.1.1.-) n=1 Tax=Marinactinospora thermotolerans DSM 45154 TaxID=1122192 RepID=A0A1T4LQT7_9ACTN|nr:extracellular solute-binding protein [Marinactinospora thermotolerans]SJZ57102.1 carbohydrate ABC transporter substrate-binding protein, CUT1 family (TC 3.A.1.1.-) [Marinactinospora thermotolerans DSM 45154]
MRTEETPLPAPAPAIGRRGFLAGALTAAGIGLAGCGGGIATVGESRTVLRQWNLFTGGDGVRMVEMHDAYQREHPQIDFRPTTYLWGNPFYTKFAMGAAGGRAFDVATLHLSRLRGMGPGTLIDPIPVELLAEYGVTPDTVLPNVWDKCTVDGELYAIPLDTHLVVTYYNREICARAGVLDPQGRLIETDGVEEFLDLLAAVKDVTGGYGVVMDTTGAWRQFWSLYRQLGGEMTFDGDVGIDDDKALQALDFLRRVSEEGLAPSASDAPGTPANFVNGICGLMFAGNWEIATAQAAGMDFGMRPFPGLYGDELGQGDSHALVLPHRRTRDDAAVRAAVEYAAWMLKHSITWAGGGHVPAYLPVTESAEYARLEPQADYRDAAVNVQFDPEAWFSGSAAQLQNEASSLFAGVHNGSTTPERALDAFKRATRKLIETPAPV